MADERNPEAPTQFSLHFEYAEDSVLPNELPASVLARALTGVQRMVHLIAMKHEKQEIQTRARITRDIEQRFPVMCRMPVQGSYALPISIGTPSPNLIDPVVIATVAAQSHDVLNALSNGDLSRFCSLIPDAKFREYISKAVKSAVPKTRTGYSFCVHDGSGQRIFDAHYALPHIEEMQRPTNQVLLPATDEFDTGGIVTGKFVRVDFEARKLVLSILKRTRCSIATIRTISSRFCSTIREN